MAGEVQAGFSGIPNVVQSIRAGKLKVLGISLSQRSKSMPDVPTLDSIYPGFEVTANNGLVAPAKTPPAILAAMSAEARKAVMAPELAESMQAEAIIPVGSTPAQFRQWIVGEVERWTKIVQENGIKPEE